MSAAFDREWVLGELLPAKEQEKAGAALATLLGGDFAILDPAGAVLWGRLAEGAEREPLVLELEPIGYVAARVPAASLRSAAALIRQILSARSRYILAADFHNEAVNADYEALKASETRYKALSQALEQRVREQVAQIEAQQRQLYVTDKFAAVGQLAAGVAHEINNPVGFIRSNLNTLRGYLQQFAELKSDLTTAGENWQRLDLDFALEDGLAVVDECVAGADRISRIVKDLKGFSNVDHPAEEVLDISECVQRAVSLVTPRLPPGVRLRVELSPLPPRSCQPWQLAEAFHNILQNAVQAVSDGGEIRIRSLTVDNQLVIRIDDDGAGIPPDQLERVFDPFYSTRDVGKGTGLGLTVTRDIVQAHGGTVAIASQPGRGTCVTVALPL
ncbi:MAG TPA: ATP-binding protein [Rhodocyclaceae bacterium]|nr:ATP-binding protein [Rhodocyclaceae bacterium]